ncbi:hypothetical protein IAU60_004053 [Kwoniella sp. DSM 27419]
MNTTQGGPGGSLGPTGVNMSDPDVLANLYIQQLILSDPMPVLGPYLLSLAADCILFGLFIEKFFFWLSWSARTEKWKVKGLVITIALLVTGSTIFMLHFLVQRFVYGFGVDYIGFFDVGYLTWFPLWKASIISLAQLFYAERAYKLNGRKPYILVIVGLILASTWIGCLGIRIYGSKITNIAEVYGDAYQHMIPFFYVWLVTGLCGDLFLLGMITRGLLKSRTGWSHTDSLVKRLIRLSLETQLPGTLTAIAFIIQFGVASKSTMDVFFAMVHPKVYAITLMACLNARISLRARTGTTDPGSRPIQPNIYERGSYPVAQATVDTGNVDYSADLRTPAMQVDFDQEPDILNIEKGRADSNSFAEHDAGLPEVDILLHEDEPGLENSLKLGSAEKSPV